MCRRRSRAPIGRGLSRGRRRRRSPCADWWPNLPGAGCGSTTAPSGHLSAAKASASKKTVLASEQNRPDVARKRRRWKTRQGRIDPRRLVFIDETWAKTNMGPLRGWAPRGQRLPGQVPYGHWHDIPRRPALRPHRCAMGARRANQWRKLPGLCLARAGPGAGSRRHRRDGQSRQPQGQGHPPRDRRRRGEAILPATLQSRSQPDRGGVRQTEAFLAKSRRAHRPRHVAEAIDRAIAEKMLTNEVRHLFNDLSRLLLATAGARAKAGDEDLARVFQLIQALRAKTVDQGCTEQEALASANKVVELLDRYGLSLSEIELRRQVCEGIGIDTERRRRGAFDTCVPGIAGFCDCKVWTETTATGPIRYIFFGLPADVEAAHFLYDLIDVTFTTETTQFKTGAIYGYLDPDERRKAVNSFQIGLSHGIAGKLKTMKAERDVTNKTSSGRDLMPLKTSVIDDELTKLGLSFQVKSRARRKRVLVDAYEAG